MTDKKMVNNITEYHDFLKNIKGLSDRTIFHYFSYHKNFYNKEITQRSINKFVKSKKNNSVCRGYLLSYLKFLNKEKEFEIPTAKTGAVKKRLARPISKQEINKMISYAYNNNKRDGLILDLSYYGALRRSELSTIKINSFNWGKWFKDPEQFCEFNLIGKRNKERIVITNPRVPTKIIEILILKKEINKYMGEQDILQKLRNDDEILFKKLTEQIIYEHISSIAKKSVGRHIRTHELRHARATELEDAGAGIRDIQKYLGHTNMATTEIYLHSEDHKALDRIKKITSQDL
jgi:site-specific recombinase XerD